MRNIVLEHSSLLSKLLMTTFSIKFHNNIDGWKPKQRAKINVFITTLTHNTRTKICPHDVQIFSEN